MPTPVALSEDEREAIETLASFVVPPKSRCPVCHRRVNAPRQNDSPATKQLRITLPTERMESVEEAFDALQELTGADPYSYPKGVLLEALLLIGAQHREQLKSYFEGTE